MKYFALFIVSGFIVFGSILNGYALDEIRLLPGFQPTDHRYRYPDLVLEEALKATIDSDGPFKIIYSSEAMVRNRALVELIKGHHVNVHIAATRANWEQTTIPIRIPILKGLLGYRLLLVHKTDQEKFKDIHDIDILKQLNAGSGSQWTTTAVLKKAGFNVITGVDYEGLFGMLNAHRFNYFPRGVNEIFDEFGSKKEKYPNITIEPTKVLYFPTPSYFFVSPKDPEIADRIKRGLEVIIQNGMLDKLFQEKYGDAIVRAKFDNREILSIENPLLSPETPLDRPELWFYP